MPDHLPAVLAPFSMFSKKKNNRKVQITHRKNPAENYDISVHHKKVHG